jgi:hypothetical protein
VKQSGKRLAALAEPLVIHEVPHFAVVRCGINRGLAVVIRLLQKVQALHRFLLLIANLVPAGKAR